MSSSLALLKAFLVIRTHLNAKINRIGLSLCAIIDSFVANSIGNQIEKETPKVHWKRKQKNEKEKWKDNRKNVFENMYLKVTMNLNIDSINLLELYYQY